LLSSRLATIPRRREAENQMTLKVASQKISPSAKEQSSDSPPIFGQLWV
jgi:hypothetical protein